MFLSVLTSQLSIFSMHVAYFAHPMFLESVTLVIFGGSFSLGIVTVLTLFDPTSDLVRHNDFPVPDAFLDL
jgi:carotenoid cleavage dioxygenase-like enzyme